MEASSIERRLSTVTHVFDSHDVAELVTHVRDLPYIICRLLWRQVITKLYTVILIHLVFHSESFRWRLGHYLYLFNFFIRF